jgi:hypothetical protein
MGNPILLKTILQSTDNGLLANNFTEETGP